MKKVIKRLLVLGLVVSMTAGNVTIMPVHAAGANNQVTVATEENGNTFWYSLVTALQNVLFPNKVRAVTEDDLEITDSEARTQLKALIEKADTLNESDYTTESWAEFWDVRDSIEDADEIPDQFVETILKNLEEAIDGLQETTLKKLKD